MYRRLTLIGALGITLIAPGSATAAPAPQTTIEITATECAPGGNDIAVTASLLPTDLDLTELHFSVDRLEEMHSPPSYFAGQYEQVESLSAHFHREGRGKKAITVPTSHTLDTTDRATWSWHGWADETSYVDRSSAWVVQLEAYASGPGAPAVFDGVYDCATGEWGTLAWPEWSGEEGEL